MAELMSFKAPSGATIIIRDDACKGKTPEENQAAFEHFNKVVNECLYRAAMKGRLKIKE